MKLKQTIFYIFLVVFASSFLLIGASAHAQTREITTGFNNLGDFMLNTGRVEMALDAGEKKTTQIIVTNRLGKDSKFKVEVEDFGSSDDANAVTKLYGDKEGPHSLKKYIKPELNLFDLKAGEQMSLNIDIEIPKDSSAGGLYGTVLVSNMPEILPPSSQIGQENQLGISSRIGVLFFVKVSGNVAEEGSLTGFSPDKFFYTKDGKVVFNYTFKNNGNVHLNPSGEIIVKNMFARQVENIKIDPFFVLPETTRSFAPSWSNRFMFGRYSATINLNKGYDGGVEQETIRFWVIPAPIIVIVLLTILALIIVMIVEKNNKGLRKKNDLAGQIGLGKLKQFSSIMILVILGLISYYTWLKPFNNAIDGVIINDNIIPSISISYFTAPVSLDFLDGFKGESNMDVAWKVKTSNGNGYKLELHKDHLFRADSGRDNKQFSDYLLTGNPTYNWSVASGEKKFGFAIKTLGEGGVASAKYTNDGENCGVEGGFTTLKCWDAIPNTIPTQLITRSTPTDFLGITTTINIKAEIGEPALKSLLEDGKYTTIITATVTAL